MWNPPSGVPKLHDITAPGPDVIRDSEGNLYGTTSRIIFYTGGLHLEARYLRYADDTHEFTEGEKSNPQSPLLLDSVGNLYGTTRREARTVSEACLS